MGTRYGRTCAILFAVSALASPLAAQGAVGGGSSKATRVENDRELARARRALEAASEAMEDAIRQLERAGRDSAARTAASEALNEAAQAVSRAQLAYSEQQQRAFTERARRMMQEQLRRARVDARVAEQRARSRSTQGWLGVTLSQPPEEADRDFPLVVSVEPGSPADRGGLQAGDLLLEIDGRKLGKGKPSVTRLLHPGARIPIRVRRGDTTRELRVLVGRRPGGYVYSFRTDETPGTAPATVVTPMPPIPPMPPARTAVPTPRPAPAVVAIGPGSSFSNFYFNGVATIAGAQLWSVDELKDYFHVDDGLLVLRVLPGTPAERAGLRSGDVIVRADGRTVSSLRTFQHALERANDRSGDHTLPVDIVRKGRGERVTLAW